MKSIKPFILIKPDLNHKKRQMVGDVELQIENQFEKNLRLAHPQIGVAVAVPKGELSWKDGNKKFECNIEVGDTLFIDHFCFYTHSYKKQDHIVHDGDELYRAHFEDVFFIDRDGEIIMCSDYVLCEEVVENNFESSFLVVPETSKKVLKNKYKVLHLPNIDTDVKVGDIVVNDRRFLSYPLTYKGKNYFRCVLDELVAIEK